jgi:hypothetical protein
LCEKHRQRGAICARESLLFRKNKRAIVVFADGWTPTGHARKIIFVSTLLSVFENVLRFVWGSIRK